MLRNMRRRDMIAAIFASRMFPKKAMVTATSGLDLHALARLDEALCKVLKTTMKYYPQQCPSMNAEISLKDYMSWYCGELEKLSDCLWHVLDDPPPVSSKSWPLVKDADSVLTRRFLLRRSTKKLFLPSCISGHLELLSTNKPLLNTSLPSPLVLHWHATSYFEPPKPHLS